MNGFRETDTYNTGCNACKYFRSYNAEYEDELEHHDYGRCRHEKMRDFDECFGAYVTCDLWCIAGK